MKILFEFILPIIPYSHKNSVSPCLYETPTHPGFWLVESLLPLFKPLRFHGFDFVLRRFSLGSLPHMRDGQFVFAFPRSECGENVFSLLSPFKDKERIVPFKFLVNFRP